MADKEKMKIDVFNTHIEIYPYSLGDIPVIEKMYTAIDHHSGMLVPCGFLIDNGKLYIPRGTPISRLEYILDTKANYIVDSDPYHPISVPHEPFYDPRDQLQEKSIEFLCGPEPQKSLNLATGKGKAEPYSNVIPTPDGFRRFGDLKIGDHVFSRSGTPTKILDIYEQGVQDIYEIKFEDGRIAYCTKEHLWTVVGLDGKYRTLMTSDLEREYNWDIYHHDFDEWIPMCEPAQYTLYSNNDIDTDPWELGDYIGKEAIQNNNRSISIPDEYMYNDPDIRLMVLQGILDRQSFFMRFGNRYRIDFTCSNHLLVGQMLMILYSLGHTGKMYKDPFTDVYHLSFSVFDEEEHDSYIEFIDRIDLYDMMHYNHYTHLKIEHIRFVRCENARCIVVDNPEHLYLTSDYIVTHNTFCVAYASNKLRRKTLIITPTEGLKVQWINTYKKMIGYRENQICNIAGGAVIDAINSDLIEPADIYVANHSTLRNYLTSTNGWVFHQFMKKLNVGIKVYDEAHLDFANILLLDNFSNTDQTWYLTATFGRSDKSEQKCFKQAFSSLINFGESESMQDMRKHVIYHTVQINTGVDPYHRAKLMAYPGFTAAKFGKYAFLEDKDEHCYNAIKRCLDLLKDKEGKVLIFVPLIDAVEAVADKLVRDYPDKKIGRYHSKMPKDEKELELEKDIIVSTIKSCGTGKDIPGLRALISVEPLASRIGARQLVGRLRPYSEILDTYFFDIVPVDILPCMWWWKARYKAIQDLVKATVYLRG